MYNFRKNIKGNSGFTLIEMIIALSIFVIVILVAADIFVVINNSQRRVATMQKLQDDVRYLFESMAQEIRLGRINYAFYQDPNGNGSYTNAIDLHPQAASPRVLAIINQAGEQIFFRFNSTVNAAQYCKLINPGDCTLTADTGWENVTPLGVKILHLSFFITPSADPFLDVAGYGCLTQIDCGGANACQSYRWDSPAGQCQYYSDGYNYQPKVRIILKTEGIAQATVEQSRITMETIVSTRIAAGKVQNTFHD
jgi:prepilin-type N-terminal cleavage/methylation domain-containing protein